jgi:UDP-N-acetylglucosamine--N-acetylmuramyl-(pentapeptide) pyrophosphoryl-undecaprenol N-acetylglucosamine transferase
VTPRVAYFVHGRGQGHASRALNVVPALRAAGLHVSLHASGDALAMLSSLGEVAPRSLIRPGPSGYIELMRRAITESVALRAQGADLVLSDGDQGALLAARVAGLPALAMGHDLAFTRCVLPRGLSRAHLAHQRINALVPTILSQRRIAVHFLPVVSFDPATRVARPEFAPPEVASATRGNELVCYFRDGAQAKILAHTHSLGAHVRVFGGRGSERITQTRAEFRALLQRAAAVVGSAGSNLIAECVMLGTPFLALYRRGDAEQALNAHMLEQAGLGMAASFEQATRSLFRHFWSRAKQGDFQRIDLHSALPSIVDVALAEVWTLLGREPTAAHPL